MVVYRAHAVPGDKTQNSKTRTAFWRRNGILKQNRIYRKNHKKAMLTTLT